MISEYIKYFKELNTAKRFGRTAPHKAVLLISILELINDRDISTPCIDLSETLIDKFKTNWHIYVGRSLIFKLDITKPFWHLKSEPFWHLMTFSGKDIKSSEPVYNITELQSGYFATIDKQLFDLALDPDNLKTLKEVLIKYF